MTTYYAAHAAAGPDLALEQGVEIDITGDTISQVRTPVPVRSGPTRLGDLALPGFANCHSHVFHRALRGRTHSDGGTFWTWREQMYALARVLDPDLLHRLALAVYGEMAATGIAAVGEFHYLHHGPGGHVYDDPNATGEALIEAAREVGLRIALLDTCYLSSGFTKAPEGVQQRFSDGDAARWADRVEELHAKYAGVDGVVVGAAIHSVRAVPADQLATVARWADDHGAPLHVHLSEQAAENDECLAVHRRTPTALLAEHGVWGSRSTAVHATHLTGTDIAILGEHQVHACFCPTTERDLADGVGPSRRLHDAGARLTLGSDSHAVIDLFEEMRAVELDERLVGGVRGTWSAAELLTAATVTGMRSLGFGDAGVIEAGQRADLFAFSMESRRTSGTEAGLDAAVFVASAADVDRVLLGGVEVDPDIAADLGRAISQCWRHT